MNPTATTAAADRIKVGAEALRKTCTALFQALGVPPEDADLSADVFLNAELRGEESHGMRLLLHVLGRLKAGSVLARPKVTVLMDRAAVALFDAHHSMGQVVAARAMRLAMDKARRHGVGLVGVRNANSYTSAKYYPLMAAGEGMIGMTYTNSIPMMPPEGGRTPILGNNPLAMAAPAATEFPFVLDMACATAKEKIFQAQERGERIPPTWALDREGNPTSDPGEVLQGGVLLPFGGYKAFGLAMAHEVLTALLTGGPLFNGGSTGFLPYEGPMNVSQYLQAIDIRWFVPLAEFRARMDELIRAVKASALRPGVQRVYVPGEQGFLEEQRRRRDGVPLPKRVFHELRRWAVELRLPPLEAMA
ncbi:MAG: Ldh family oxidoreductase [Candidatus Methylomirabilales bacterium]